MMCWKVVLTCLSFVALATRAKSQSVTTFCHDPQEMIHYCYTSNGLEVINVSPDDALNIDFFSNLEKVCSNATATINAMKCYFQGQIDCYKSNSITADLIYMLPSPEQANGLLSLCENQEQYVNIDPLCIAEQVTKNDSTAAQCIMDLVPIIPDPPTSMTVEDYCAFHEKGMDCYIESIEVCGCSTVKLIIDNYNYIAHPQGCTNSLETLTCDTHNPSQTTEAPNNSDETTDGLQNPSETTEAPNNSAETTEDLQNPSKTTASPGDYGDNSNNVIMSDIFVIVLCITTIIVLSK